MSSNVYTSDVTVDDANQDQLKESIRLREQRLAANVDELVGRLHPKALTNRAADSAKSLVVTEDGNLRTDRLALVAGLVLGTAALLTFMAARNNGD